MPEQDVRFGQRLAEARDAKGLTQAQLAEKIGASERAVQQWESEGRSPRKKYQPLLVAALGKPWKWFFDVPIEEVEAAMEEVALARVAPIATPPKPESRLARVERKLDELIGLVKRQTMDQAAAAMRLRR